MHCACTCAARRFAHEAASRTQGQVRAASKAEEEGRAVAGCHMSQLATVSPYFQMMGLQRIDVAHLAVALQM